MKRAEPQQPITFKIDAHSMGIGEGPLSLAQLKKLGYLFWGTGALPELLAQSAILPDRKDQPLFWSALEQVAVNFAFHEFALDKFDSHSLKMWINLRHFGQRGRSMALAACAYHLKNFGKDFEDTDCESVFRCLSDGYDYADPLVAYVLHAVLRKRPFKEWVQYDAPAEIQAKIDAFLMAVPTPPPKPKINLDISFIHGASPFRNNTPQTQLPEKEGSPEMKLAGLIELILGGGAKSFVRSLHAGQQILEGLGSPDAARFQELLVQVMLTGDFDAAFKLGWQDDDLLMDAAGQDHRFPKIVDRWIGEGEPSAAMAEAYMRHHAADFIFRLNAELGLSNPSDSSTQLMMVTTRTHQP